MIEKFKLPIAEVNVLHSMKDDIDELDNEVRRAEEIGIDVSEIKNQLTDVKKLREGLLKNYTD